MTMENNITIKQIYSMSILPTITKHMDKKIIFHKSWKRKNIYLTIKKSTQPVLNTDNTETNKELDRTEIKLNANGSSTFSCSIAAFY